MTLFISFEGGDGSGKSTQANALHKRFEQTGVDCLFVREPGSTPLGKYLRDWLKRERAGEDEMSPVSELFLFEAARAELVDKVIRPALDDGKVVVTDRYADSSLAYQGYGRGLSTDMVMRMNEAATGGLVPHATVLFDCPPEQALARTAATNSTNTPSRNDAPGTRRFEQESLEFHTKVRNGYRDLAEREPQRWYIVDASRTPQEIAEAVWEIVRPLLG